MEKECAITSLLFKTKWTFQVSEAKLFHSFNVELWLMVCCFYILHYL